MKSWYGVKRVGGGGYRNIIDGREKNDALMHACMHDDHEFVKQNKYNQTLSSYHTIHISYHKIKNSQIQPFPSPEDVTGGEEKATDYMYITL